MIKLEAENENDYYTIEEFLIEVCGCYCEIDDPVIGQVKIYDGSKSKKSLKEYLSQTGYTDLYDSHTARIYKTKQLYDKHIKCVESAKLQNVVASERE